MDAAWAMCGDDAVGEFTLTECERQALEIASTILPEQAPLRASSNALGQK